MGKARVENGTFPGSDERKRLLEVESFVPSRVGLEIGASKAEEGESRPEAVLLEMYKSPSKLNKPLVEGTVGSGLCAPQLLQNLMGFEEQLAVETVEECQVIAARAHGLVGLEQCKKSGVARTHGGR